MRSGKMNITKLAAVGIVSVAASAMALDYVEVIDVAARQRYPWNGLVDLHFTITGDAGTKYDTSFTAKDMVGNTNIAMRTIRKADGTSAAAKEQLLPGSYNWVWDAAVDLPKDFKCDRVTVTGTADVSAFPYSVKFNANGGTGSMANESFIYGMAKALTANAFTRTGYTFQGWATSANGAKVYNDKQSVSNLTETSGTVVNLYAVWKSALYMVIDLSSGTSSSKYPVSYLDAVPSGGWSDTYKTTKMVLRRVSKGTNSAGGSMSKDMWVGVFEVTQKQWMLVVNGYPEIYSGPNYSATKGDTLPIEGVEYAYDHPSPFLSKVKTRSGVNVRLPTVTEWQYACRSGTSTDLNNGTSLTVANANKVAYWGLGVSGATAYHKYGYGMGKPTIVGSYAANKWGLFDMHGNVKEYTSTIHYQVGGSYYDACGGGYDSELSGIKASSVAVSQAVGFRVFAEVQ